MAFSPSAPQSFGEKGDRPLVGVGRAKSRKRRGRSRKSRHTSRINNVACTEKAVASETWRIFVCGGINPLVRTDDISGTSVAVYNFSAAAWLKTGRLPEARHHHTVAWMCGYIYVIGGTRMSTVEPKSPGLPTNNVLRFAPKTFSWVAVAPMHHARVFHAALVLQDVLYVIGGQDVSGNILQSVECYNHTTDAWKEIAPLNHPRIGLGAIAWQGRILAVGGLSRIGNQRTAVPYVEVLEPGNPRDRWKSCTALPVACCHVRLAIVDDRVFCVCGANRKTNKEKSFNALPHILEYEPETDTWREMTRMKTPRYDVGIVTIGSSIILIGGYHEGRPCALVDQYDLTTNTWQKLSPYVSPVVGLAACAFNASFQ